MMCVCVFVRVCVCVCMCVRVVCVVMGVHAYILCNSNVTCRNSVLGKGAAFKSPKSIVPRIYLFLEGADGLNQ